ncbi:lysostaphin resistance A-like protein [Methanobrevibacter sp. DSM 116169]|uniref:CPBP family intramembrane glutamic endopeptidase n=1 Tax=Methanobrevibacter sp. DSM 116169 TaxID=3242727 RepID=UPI0038FC47E1
MYDSDRFSQKHIVIFSLIVSCVFVFIFGFGFLTIFTSLFIPPEILAIPSIEYFLSAINNFIALLFILILLKSIGLFDNIPWNISGVQKGLVLGISLLIFTVVQMLLIFIITPDKTIVIGLIPMINTLLYCLSIGLWEETLCRGFLLTNMLKKWGNTKRGMVISIVFSSFIFGGLHIISAINGNLFGSLVQVMYASVMGILLSVIYIKTKSLWSVIVLHIILNFPAYSMPYLVPGSAGMPFGLHLILIVLFNLLWIIVSYFLIIRMDVSDVEDLLDFNQKS